jgi:hypothetical protein
MTTTQGTSDDMVQLAQMAGETMAPWLGEIEGFRGIAVLSSRETGITHVITLWESAEVAERHREARMRLRDGITAAVDVDVLETHPYDVAFWQVDGAPAGG